MNGFMISVLCGAAVLGGIGLLCALLLVKVARKFVVVEDPRIDQVESMLPGANCGGCGFSGCRAFAKACVGATSLAGIDCAVAGKDGMEKIASVLGLTAMKSVPKVAVVKCGGGCDDRRKVVDYEGVRSCKVMAMSGGGESACVWGCLGGGDCVLACHFGAIKIDAETGLAVVDDDRCTGCGACVAACPRNIIEMRSKGPRGMRVWVACSNHDKGAVAMKACDSSCIGCGKCVKACSHGAIKVEDNLAYIDPDLCKLCRKCVDTCPKDAIVKINFPEARINENVHV